MTNRYRSAVLLSLFGATICLAQSAAKPNAPPPVFSADDFPKTLKPLPLYAGAIPNSTGATDEEKTVDMGIITGIREVSVPTMTVYLPAKNKSAHSAIVVFPGGGYEGLSWSYEGTSIGETLQDHGIAAIAVKYRLPSDRTMKDKSIGPLQDAQQAIRLVRQHAVEWGIDPAKVGVMGFSAGGHLASTAGTHFKKSYLPNAESSDLRPSFQVLVYPVISMSRELTHPGSRKALLGPNPSDAQMKLFSNELQVSDDTPPTFLVHAGDDGLVDVDNSIQFYEALHQHHVAAEMLILPKGNHGFFGISRDEWLQPVFAWLRINGWMKP